MTSQATPDDRMSQPKAGPVTFLVCVRDRDSKMYTRAVWVSVPTHDAWTAREIAAVELKMEPYMLDTIPFTFVSPPALIPQLKG